METNLCCSCERSFSPEKLKQGYTIDSKGKLQLILTCEECESVFTLEKYHKSLAIFS
jgi:RNase P subunit RPR2